MSELSPFAQWLNSEIETAEAEYRYWSTSYGDDTPAAEYWRGYAEAMINALAAHHGATPLEGGE